MSDEVVQEEINPFAIFPMQVRAPVVGLSYIGHLERTITFAGHSFVIKTLRPSEKAAIATAIEPWRGNIAESTAFSNGHVGLALVSIDGEDSFCPPASPEITQFARARLNYLTNPETGWYQPVLDYLYAEYLALEQEVLNALEAYRNLELGNQKRSQPSADSSTEPDTSDEPTALDTPPSDPSS